MRKICVVTGTRAEYGLLKNLIQEIEGDAELTLQLVVTGSHLSAEFGETYKEIEAEFEITKKIPMDLSSDAALAISKSMANLQIDMSDSLHELRPDIVVILGDRYEMLSVAISAMMLKIPIAHIHGGETTEGLIDESIRHAITKMSHLHFVATEEYKNRVLQLGESPQRVFNFGGIGIDNIKNLKLLEKEDLQELLNFTFNTYNLLVTFHPVTLENNTSKEQFEALLASLDKLEDTNIIFTHANADTDGKIINTMIKDYVKRNDSKSTAFISMGQLKYLSTLQYVDAIVGNSSSGLIEAPSFKIATINIGERQKGRVKAKSVIDCDPTQASIDSALQTCFSSEFQKNLKYVTNPYGSGSVSGRIKSVLASHDLQNILKKTFYDIKVFS